MKEKQWIYIPINNKEVLSEYQQFYSYDTEDEENGKIVAYTLDVGSKEYNDMMLFLQQNNIYYYIFRRLYKFTKKELEQSEIIRLTIGDSAKESVIKNSQNLKCIQCGKKIPSLNDGNLYVDYKKIKKYDFMTTYFGEPETIVSEKLRNLFINENVTGILDYKPVYQIGSDNKVVEGFYQLILQEGIGELVEPTITEKLNYCSECGLYEEYLCKTTLHFRKNSWLGLDICYIKDWLGYETRYSKNTIISNKLYKILVDNKIKNIYFEPAFFVD